MSAPPAARATLRDVPTVYIVDDDAAVREALAYLVESMGFAACAHEGIAGFLDAFRPGALACLVLDVRLPGMSGMEFLERSVHGGFDLPVIVLSGHGTVSMASRALRCGAIDFIPKPLDEQLLLDRIHEALEGSRARLTRMRVEEHLATLTPREREVVALVVEGRQNKEIAAALGISPRTVERHRGLAMKKLGVRTSAQLAAAALGAAAPGAAPARRAG